MSELVQAIAKLESSVMDLLRRVEVLEGGSPLPPEPNPPAFFIEGYAEKVTGGPYDSAYVVTTLADAGPGSFREAISQGDRVILFDVEGIISAKSQLLCNASNLTIDAMGKAVTIEGNGLDHTLRFGGCHNVIVHNLKIQGKKIDGGNERDALSIENSTLMAFDHCVFRWGTDESVGVKDSTDITFQWCMIYETLLPHSTGMLIREGTDRINVHHSLFAHNRQRNPQFGIADNPDAVFDLRNCVIYNDGVEGRRAAIEFKKNGSINVIGNYYKRGPDGKKPFAMVVEPGGKVYTENNWIVNATSWLDPAKQGQALTIPASVPAIETENQLDAYNSVMQWAGTEIRDTHDLRLLRDVEQGTGNIKD